MSGSEDGSRRAICGHDAPRVEGNDQLCRFHELLDWRVRKHNRLGREGHETNRVDVKNAAFVLGLVLIMIVGRDRIVIMIMRRIDPVVIRVSIDCDCMQAACMLTIKIMSVRGLRGGNAGSHQGHGHDGRNDLTYPGHRVLFSRPILSRA